MDLGWATNDERDQLAGHRAALIILAMQMLTDPDTLL
jgi:hypothetical protein